MTQMTNADRDNSAEDPADRAACEHERRELVWHPAVRWQAIQETIRWAESQATARRNTPRSCIERERRIRDEQGSANDAAHAMRSCDQHIESGPGDMCLPGPP